jgi:hypothetical protein
MRHDTGTSVSPRGARLRPPPGWRRQAAAERRLRGDPRPPRLTAALGALGLLGVLVGSLVVVAVAARGPGSLSPPSHSHFFPAWLSGPLSGAWPFPSTNSTLLRVFDYAVAGMYPFYLLAIVFAPRLRRPWVLATILGVHVIFLLAPPLALTDVFNYINYGRMEIVHGLNPYATIPALEPHGDPAFALSNWHHLLSPYGPLFTIFTFALVPLGVATSFWVFKATLMLASLGTLWLVWRCAELLHRDPLKAVLLVGLNPPVLVWGLGGAHNDFLMVVLMMLAVYLLLSSRGPAFSRALAIDRDAIGGRRVVRLARGGVLRARRAVTAATAARPARPVGRGVRRPLPLGRLAAARVGGGPPLAGAPPAPIVAASAPAIPALPVRGGATGPRVLEPRRVARVATREDVVQFLAGGVLVAACAIKLPAAILAPIILVASARRTYLLAGMAAGFLAVAVASYAAFGARLPDLGVQSNLVTSVGLPNLLGAGLGLGGETVGLRTVLTGLLLVLVGLCAAWARRRHGDWLVPGAVAVFALVLTLSWQAPWYVLWLLPLAALTRRPHLRIATLVLGVYLILAYTSLVNVRPPTTQLGRVHAAETQHLVH